MAPIRLLFVLASSVRGGVEEVVLALAQRLDRAEFTVGLAAPAPRLGAHGRADVVARFDLDRQVRATAAQYRAVLSGTRAAGSAAGPLAPSAPHGERR